jgi:hypothetical protein
MLLFIDTMQPSTASKKVPIEEQIATLEAQRRMLVKERDDLKAKLDLE